MPTPTKKPSPSDYYQRLLQTADFESILKGFTVKYKGGNTATLKACCPNHESISGESLHISIDKGHWYCFGCGVGGDKLQLVEFLQTGKVSRGTVTDSHRAARDWLAASCRMESLSVLCSIETRDEMASEWAEARDVYDCLTQVCEYFHAQILKPENEWCLELLQDQWGITRATVERLKIGYADYADFKAEDFGGTARMLKTGAFIDTPKKVRPFFKNRIVFPYWVAGRVQYAIARRTDETADNKWESAKYKKLLVNSAKHPYVSPVIQNVIYGGDSVTKETQIAIITEGITDAIMLQQAGFVAVSPVTVRFKKSDIERLQRIVKGVKYLYIINDNEISGAGEGGAIDTATVLARSSIYPLIVELPLEDSQRDARAKLDLADGAITDDELSNLRASSKIDLAEYLKAHSKQEFETLLRLGLPAAVYAVRAMRGTRFENQIRIEEICETINHIPAKHKRLVIAELQLKFPKEISAQEIKEISNDVAPKKSYDMYVCECIDRIKDRYLEDGSGSWYTHVNGVWVATTTYRSALTDDVNTHLLRGNGHPRQVSDLSQAIIDRCALRVLEPNSADAEILSDRPVFDANPRRIPFINGVYDLDSKELLPHSPLHYRRFRLNTLHDPKASCPRWEKFLYEVQPDDQAARDAIEEWIGYNFFSAMPIHVACFFLGQRGRNGKGVIMRLLTALLGSQNVAATGIEQLDDPVMIATLRGKLANIAGEMEPREISTSRAFKALTGDDLVTGCEKYKAPIKFYNYAKLLFAQNALPNFADSSEAIGARILIIPFMETFAGREDTDLTEKLMQELPGIANRCLVALERLLARGRFYQSQRMKDANTDRLTGTTGIGMWLSDNVGVEAGLRTPAADLYQDYLAFAMDNGFKAPSAAKFAQKCQELAPQLLGIKWDMKTAHASRYKTFRAIEGVTLKKLPDIGVRSATVGRGEQSQVDYKRVAAGEADIWDD